MEYLAALLVIVSLLIYGILFSIECGATIFVAFPELLGGNDLVHKYINPAWETTNVLLVTALVSLIAFFPKALPVWGVALIVPFLIFLLVMGVRVIGMLYVFYSSGTNRAMRLLLLVAGLAAPAILAGGLFPFFISGAMPYHSTEWTLALVFGLLALVSTMLISSSFFHYLNRRSKQIESLRTFVKSSLLLFLAVALISYYSDQSYCAASHLGTRTVSAGINSARYSKFVIPIYEKRRIPRAKICFRPRSFCRPVFCDRNLPIAVYRLSIHHDF